MTYPPQPGQPYDPAQQPAAQPDPYGQGQPAPDPYAQPAPDPYAQPAQDPYAQPGQYPPPQQPGAYGHTSGAPYGQPGGDPYAQQPPTQHFQVPQQPMYAAPTAPQKSKVGLFAAIGGGALLVVILLVVLIVALSGGGPGGVVEEYLEAAKAADFEEANNLVCSLDSDTYLDPTAFSDPADRAEWEAAVADMEWEVLSESEVGDSASVVVKITSSSEFLAGTETFTLEKIDGDWKVCSSGS
ncbi:hypothetical protein AB0I28_37285 [Phytomonospora sp. NPDC050363]|uniref:Rv0361 family membrane protein n=1 Tax=Phytomonospora sp. NPDC050363 TaxID=3155642 RepID=UPI00340154A4